jgi:hypothetical protein
MNEPKLPPVRLTNQQQYEKADRDRRITKEWLLELMSQSPMKPATKGELRQLAIEKFGVSQNAFDGGWIQAIEQSGNHHWYDSQPRKKIVPPN